MVEHIGEIEHPETRTHATIVGNRLCQQAVGCMHHHAIQCGLIATKGVADPRTKTGADLFPSRVRRRVEKLGSLEFGLCARPIAVRQHQPAQRCMGLPKAGGVIHHRAVEYRQRHGPSPGLIGRRHRLPQALHRTADLPDGLLMLAPQRLTDRVDLLGRSRQISLQGTPGHQTSLKQPRQPVAHLRFAEGREQHGHRLVRLCFASGPAQRVIQRQLPQVRRHGLVRQ